MQEKASKHTDKPEPKIGDVIDSITFSSFVKELTGVEFESIFQSFKNKGQKKDEKSNLG